jgi:hypothetical protein
MAINLRPPSQGIGSTEEKLRSLYSYLFQMTDELNHALNNMREGGGEAAYRAISSASTGGGAKGSQAANAYQQLKALIIKTATEVTATTTRIVNEMASEYIASSEYGSYYEYLKKVTEETADGSLMTWESEQGVIHGEDEYRAKSDVFIKVGIVKYHDDGTVDAGIIIGRRLHAVTETLSDGTEQIHVEGDDIYTLIGPDGISLWMNGAKLTEMSQMGFYGAEADIETITTSLIKSPEEGAQIVLNEHILRAVAEQIDISANTSIRLAIEAGGTGAINYLRRSAKEVTFADGIDAATYYFGDYVPVKDEIYTVRIWGSLGTGATGYRLCNSTTYVQLGTAELQPDGTYVWTGPWSMKMATTGNIMESTSLIVLPAITATGGTHTIERIKLSAGEAVTEWCPYHEEFSAGEMVLDREGIHMTGGEIEMITRNAEDGPTGAVIIDKNGVVASGGKIEMQSVEDGEVVGGVIIDPAGIRAQSVSIELAAGTAEDVERLTIGVEGVAASSVTAPNVAAKYDGPDWICVSLDDEPGDINGTMYVRTLHEAFDLLNGKAIAGDIVIADASGEKQIGAHYLRGVTGVGEITIQRTNILGSLHIEYMSVRVNVTTSNISGETNALVTARSTVVLMGCEITRTSGAANGTIGINATGCSDVSLRNCWTYGFYYPYAVHTGGFISADNCETESQVLAEGGMMYIKNHTAKGITNWQPVLTAGAVYTDDSVGSVDSGSVTITPDPLPTVQTYDTPTVGLYAGGWKNSSEIRQGRYNSNNYAGCMWFDTLPNQTLKSATLTLKRINGSGRSSAVQLHLYAIKAEPNGDPTADPLYCGMIGEINGGETRTFSILDAAQMLATKGYKGLALYEDDAQLMSGREYSANYCRIDAASPELTVTY